MFYVWQRSSIFVQDTSDLNTLLQTFNDDGMSNYLIVFMRLLTSLNIKAQHEFYQNFLEGGQVRHTHLFSLLDLFDLRNVIYLDCGGILLQRGGTDVQGVRPHPHNRLLPTVWGQCPGDVPRQGLKQRGSAPRFPWGLRPWRPPALQARPLRHCLPQKVDRQDIPLQAHNCFSYFGWFSKCAQRRWWFVFFQW